MDRGTDVCICACRNTRMDVVDAVPHVTPTPSRRSFKLASWTTAARQERQGRSSNIRMMSVRAGSCRERIASVQDHGHAMSRSLIHIYITSSCKIMQIATINSSGTVCAQHVARHPLPNILSAAVVARDRRIEASSACTGAASVRRGVSAFHVHPRVATCADANICPTVLHMEKALCSRGGGVVLMNTRNTSQYGHY